MRMHKDRLQDCHCRRGPIAEDRRMSRDLLAPWDILSSRSLFEDQWLRLRSDDVRLPDGTVLSPYHTVDVSDSANIVALTQRNTILLVEQYRHPIQQVQLEIPAGSVSSGESPEAAARRELVEETGFGGGVWKSLGTLHPFASRLSCVVHCFLACGVAQESAPQLDRGEVLKVHERPWAEFTNELKSGVFILPEATQLAAIFLALHRAGC